MSQDTQFNIGAIVNAKELTQMEQSIAIHNKAQAKLADLEQETNDWQTEKSDLDKESEMIEENIIRLQRLKKKVDDNRSDLGRAIQANLSAIDSLRKSGVTI